MEKITKPKSKSLSPYILEWCGYAKIASRGAQRFHSAMKKMHSVRKNCGVKKMHSKLRKKSA